MGGGRLGGGGRVSAGHTARDQRCQGGVTGGDHPNHAVVEADLEADVVAHPLVLADHPGSNKSWCSGVPGAKPAPAAARRVGGAGSGAGSGTGRSTAGLPRLTYPPAAAADRQQWVNAAYAAISSPRRAQSAPRAPPARASHTVARSPCPTPR